MKYLTTLLIAAVLSNAAQGQTYLRTGYYQLWDTVASTWNDDMRIVHEFDANDGRLLNSTLDSLVSGNWAPRKRTFLGYDAQDRLDSITIQLWNEQSAQWEHSELKTSEYGTDSLSTAQQDHLWGGGSWMPVNRYVHGYDMNDRRVETLNHDWTGTWELVSRKTYIRDANGNAVVQRDEVLLPGMVWEATAIDSSVFNAQDQKLETTMWTDWFGSFVPSNRIEWTYDGYGEVATVATYLMTPFPDPVPILFETRSSAGDNLLNQTFQRNTVLPNTTPVWENDYRWIFDPQILAVQESDVAATQLLAYPNPASDSFLVLHGFQGPVDVTVYSTTGQQMGGSRRYGTAERVQLDATGLANGSYIVQCQSEGVAERTLITVHH